MGELKDLEMKIYQEEGSYLTNSLQFGKPLYLLFDLRECVQRMGGSWHTAKRCTSWTFRQEDCEVRTAREIIFLQ